MDCIRLHVFLIKCSVSVNCYILYFHFQLIFTYFDFVSVRPPDYVLFRHISPLTYFSTSRWCLRKSTILKPLNRVAFQSSCLSKPCAFTFMYILSMFISLTFFCIWWLPSSLIIHLCKSLRYCTHGKISNTTCVNHCTVTYWDFTLNKQTWSHSFFCWRCAHTCQHVSKQHI